MMQKAIVNAFVVIIVVTLFAGMVSTVAICSSEKPQPFSYDGTWVGNTSYGGVVRFNVSEDIIKDFTISTKEACADLTDINTGEKFERRCSGNLMITHTTFNDTYDFDNYTTSLHNIDPRYYSHAVRNIITEGVWILGNMTQEVLGLHFEGQSVTPILGNITTKGIFRTFNATFINVTVVQNRFTYSRHPWETIEGVFTPAKNANGTWRLQMDSKVSPNLICVYPLITWNATRVYAPTASTPPLPVTPTPAPSPTATAMDIPILEEKGIPGFEVLFAIMGLLAVAYLLRRRK